MIAAFSPGSDFKRYYRGRMPRLALAVVILMPLLYGALYLWAFWNPFGNVDKIPVAIINLDQGATVEGEPLTAGDSVVQGLIDSKQLDLTETSEQDGVDGLAHGKYYFTITVPADFSEAVASVTTNESRSAELEFTYNDSNNYLSTIIGQDAAEEVIVMVNQQVSAQMFDQALAAVRAEIPTLKEAVSSVEELNSGMQTANSGAKEIADNLVTAKEGSATLAGAIDTLDEAVQGAVTRVDSAISASGITGAELRELSSDVVTSTDTIATALNEAAAAQARADSELTTIMNELAASDNPVEQSIAARLESVHTHIKDSRLTEEFVTVFDALHADMDLLAGEFNDPESRVNVIMTAIEDGAVQRDLATASSDAEQLRSGADQLDTGLGELSAGATQLSSGTDQLAAGTIELADAADTALNLFPDWDEDQQSNFVQALAQPVELKETINNEAKTFGYGFAPFFLGLALFVGGIIAWMLFTPLQARPLAQGLGSFRVILASYVPTVFVGFLQATILYLVIYFGIGLHPEHTWGTYGFLLLMVMMFMAMIQMFNAVFGPAVGRVFTLAFLMVQLTSAGGIYPVPTTTNVFQYINVIDPMTYTNNGLRQLILGGIDDRLLTAIIVILSMTVAFIAISTWAARRNRQYNMDRLYPPVEV
ncbi:YhgE/Pip domain-containing protein [Pseudoclavibacter sp. RFBB5]|uniref:YhgE/Pip domain-containing protein n=1 Tax=Pseudoclavibacter sp. RFBB5 TaxID=2080574 RepID=UPI000CE82666|nr:YhgE/Pip domain-containing protein [Pseudoclavibacter sp. RFBB5]PPG31287.1 hypothetical protein C5B97_06020 [Pseudoclavibacter sp. RFBB5]